LFLERSRYSILDVRKLRDSSWLAAASYLFMVKLRNPWGQTEWSGKFSDDDPMWEEHKRAKKKVAHKSEDDGIFWMPWADFSKHFRGIDLVDRCVALFHRKIACVGRFRLYYGQPCGWLGGWVAGWLGGWVACIFLRVGRCSPTHQLHH
jgi:hypothetical protein